MTPSLKRRELSPAAKLNVLSFILAILGFVGILDFFTSPRLPLATLAVPIALGLLTRREFWRNMALLYILLNAAVVFGIVPFLLRLATSQPAATATGPFAPSDPTSLNVAPAVFLVAFGFTVLRQPEVKALFRPFATSPGV